MLLFQWYIPLSNYSISGYDLYIYLILYALFACVLLYNCPGFALLYLVHVSVCKGFRGVPLRTFWLLAIPAHPLYYIFNGTIYYYFLW